MLRALDEHDHETTRPRSTHAGRPREGARTARDLLRVITINTHRGQGPKLRYLIDHAAPQERARIELLHDTRAYAYHIADWLHTHSTRYHAVALQEVFFGLFGSVQHRLSGRPCQGAYYRTLGGFPRSASHRVGFSAFQYENVLLSRLETGAPERIDGHLPGRVFHMAACGFTLAPYRWDGTTVWIGNTHLHPYNPRARASQARHIARCIRSLGDAPILFLGDLNTVPTGAATNGFPHGERDTHSYRGDETLAILREAGLCVMPEEDDPSLWTYPTGHPNRTLDYILFSRHWAMDAYRVVREFTLSDHYPVEASFRLRYPA